MLISNNWDDYKILDAGDGEKLESVGGYTFVRPDSQVVWKKQNENLWQKIDAHYHRSNKGGGYWEYNKKIKTPFNISYTITNDKTKKQQKLLFSIEPTNFKHISIFPEQASNWDFIYNKIANANRPIKVLNLFAYTGAATVAAAAANNTDEVVHLDAAKKIVGMAKRNIEINNLTDKCVRFIVDDAMEFVLREGRRGRKYDAIIMDPPVYGRGPNGQMWQLEDSLYPLIEACKKILVDNPLFFLINCYTTSISHFSLKNILSTSLNSTNASVESGEIALPIDNSNLLLAAGIYARYFH